MVNHKGNMRVYKSVQCHEDARVSILSQQQLVNQGNNFLYNSEKKLIDTNIYFIG